MKNKLNSIFLKNKAFALQVLSKKKNGYLLGEFKDFQNDPHVVQIAIENNPLSFCHASDNLKKNKKLVSFAVRQDVRNLRHVSDELYNEEKFMTKLIKDCIKVAPLLTLQSLKNHKLKTTLKDDDKFMFEAMSLEHVCLLEASSRLRSSKEFLYKAMKEICTEIYIFSEGKLRKEINDSKMITKWKNNNPERYTPKVDSRKYKQEDYPEYSNSASDSDSDLFNSDSEEEKSIPSKQEVLRSIGEEAFPYDFWKDLDKKSKNDHDIIAKAIEKDAFIFDEIGEKHKNNKDFVSKLILKNPAVIFYTKLDFSKSLEKIVSSLTGRKSFKRSLYDIFLSKKNLSNVFFESNSRDINNNSSKNNFFNKNFKKYG